MTKDRAAQTGGIIAALWLVVLFVVNLTVPPSIVPDPLFAVAPLIAAAVMPARATAGFAAAATALVVLSGLWNEHWDTPQQWVRLLDVVLVGAAAVTIAAVRVSREQRFLRVAAIAEVAQRAVLPTLPGFAAGVRVAARYRSAAEDAEVGGDVYDCSRYHGRVRFLLGDVRGKGIAAVEQTARVTRAFRQSAAAGLGVSDVASEMDTYLTPFLGEEDFVTALLVDVSQPGQFTLVSCGHPPPLLIRLDGTAALVSTDPGLPLGLGVDVAPVTVPWDTGDRLLLYTDGLSEARDAHGRFLRLPDLAPSLMSSSPDDALDQLVDHVDRHVGGHLGDDLAVVLLEYDPSLPATSRPQEDSEMATA